MGVTDLFYWFQVNAEFWSRFINHLRFSMREWMGLMRGVVFVSPISLAFYGRIFPLDGATKMGAWKESVVISVTK